MNDRPVACQTREPTDPQGDRWRAAPDEGSPVPPAGAILFPKNQKGSTPAGCSLSVVLYLFFPLSATMPVRDRSASAPYSAAPGSAVLGLPLVPSVLVSVVGW